MAGGEDGGGRDPIGAELASQVAGILPAGLANSMAGGLTAGMFDLAAGIAGGITGSKIALGGGSGRNPLG